jgi:hypothetical protein
LIFCRLFSRPLLFVVHLYFSRYWSSCYAPFFSKTTFQIFHCINFFILRNITVCLYVAQGTS